ncbi:MAG: HEAT repeat domain-containing protein [Cyanobacteria bacterium P01_F01_bin.150]
MDLQQIQIYLRSDNPRDRMKGITELRHHEPEDVVPLLKQRMHDQEFMVRSFVAMGLGYKRNQEGFEALLDILEYETDPNVIAEASNSLARFGQSSVPHLQQIFREHPHWLVRQSIFAAFEDIDDPKTLLEFCQLGLDDKELVVRFAAISNLSQLSGTVHEQDAFNLLKDIIRSDSSKLRSRAARSLTRFESTEAKELLQVLRQDDDHRVVAATLEKLV